MPSLHRAGAREPVSRRPPRRRDLRLLLVVMVLGASAMATMAYVAYLLWPRWPESAIAANAPALPITVGGVTFNVPPAAIRVPMQRRPGVQDRVDLFFVWPSLDPPRRECEGDRSEHGRHTTRTLGANLRHDRSRRNLDLSG
jgi:hypothetical protein